MNFPSWLTQPLLIDIFDSAVQYQNLSPMNQWIRALFKQQKGTYMWLCAEEKKRKYPNICTSARQQLVPFPSTYLVECGFSAADNLLGNKRNRLDITKRGDLRLKLTKLSPRIKDLCRKHQAQSSHWTCRDDCTDVLSLVVSTSKFDSYMFNTYTYCARKSTYQMLNI